MNTTSDSSKKPRSVADALQLGFLDDGDTGIDPTLLKGLYRLAQSKEKSSECILKDSSFAKGWINLDFKDARDIVSAIIALDEADNLKKARQAVKLNLEAISWNDLLEIDQPPLQCQVKIHGSKWAYRFLDATPCARGTEKLNEELPPIPHDLDVPKSQSLLETQPPEAKASNAEDALRAGGMPT